MKRVLFTFTVLLLSAATGHSAQVTTVNFGTLGSFNGPGDLDFTNVIRAVDLNGTADRVVNGVQFLSDNNLLPYFFSQTFANNISAWQTAPNFGSTASANNLESIMHSIRWNGGGAPEITFNTTVGREYTLQLLWSGNRQESRIWDIEIEGALAVDEVSSLGEITSPGVIPTYDGTESYSYRHTFTATDGQLNIRYGQIFTDGNQISADRNPIIQAVTLALTPPPGPPIPEPSSFALGVVGLAGLTRLRRMRRRG